MRKIDEYLDFVKEQVGVQEKLATRYDHEPYRRNMHVKARTKFGELADYLEQIKSRGFDFDNNTLNRSLTAQKRIQLTYEDIAGLPEELIKELNVTETDRQEMEIEHIIAQSGGFLSLDKIMVELYRRTGEIHKRNTLTSRLYRMAQRGTIYNVPGKKGVYSTYEISESDARRMFGQDPTPDETSTQPSPEPPAAGPSASERLRRASFMTSASQEAMRRG